MEKERKIFRKTCAIIILTKKQRTASRLFSFFLFGYSGQTISPLKELGWELCDINFEERSERIGKAFQKRFYH